MKLYLARHGESIATGLDDERPLSDQGKKDIQHIANFILPLKLQISRILQSQKLRAQQTATILSVGIPVIENIETRYELDPLASVSDFLEELRHCEEDMLLVGHMPFMGKLTAKLVTGNEYNDIVSFKTGTLLCLEQISNEQWIIDWMMNPDLFSE